MILITSPSLDLDENVSGISSVTRFIIGANTGKKYKHFVLGKRDTEKRGFSWFIRLAGSYLRWIWLIAGQRNLLIHFNLSLTKPSVLRDSPLILISRIFRKRIIIHLHGGEFLLHENPPAWMKFLLSMVFSENIPKIVLSSLEAENLRIKFNVKNAYVLPNCTDLSETRNFERPECRNDDLTLLFIGRISKDKGVEYILRALHSLKNKGVRFRFIMAGTGPDEKTYVRKFREALGSSFEFTGVVSGRIKTDLFKKCNVFLLPSLFEGLPMSLIESMSFGLVPVTTDAGSIKSVISNGKNGLIVSMHSAEEIALAIEKLSNDSACLNELSRNAREYIIKNFNPETYVETLNEIYKNA